MHMYFHDLFFLQAYYLSRKTWRNCMLKYRNLGTGRSTTRRWQERAKKWWWMGAVTWRTAALPLYLCLVHLHVHHCIDAHVDIPPFLHTVCISHAHTWKALTAQDTDSTPYVMQALPVCPTWECSSLLAVYYTLLPNTLPHLRLIWPGTNHSNSTCRSSVIVCVQSAVQG